MLDFWKEVMQVDLLALEKTRTWKLVDLPPNVKRKGCRWVLKIKHNVDGTIQRYKGRLVAKGYTQIEGLAYFDTYSLVAKLTAFRLIIAFAYINHWQLHQLEVNNAFFHGELQEDVYMLLPRRIQAIKPYQVCKHTKSLYGQKQTSIKSYENFTYVLLHHHYIQATSNHFLFIKKTSTSFTVLLVYVDGIILAGNSLTQFQHIKSILDASFKIKDLGQL